MQEKARTEPVQLALLVDYIRRQVWHMDQLSSDQLLHRGSVTLLAFQS